jgi:hypothetical protein
MHPRITFTWRDDTGAEHKLGWAIGIGLGCTDEADDEVGAFNRDQYWPATLAANFAIGAVLEQAVQLGMHFQRLEYRLAARATLLQDALGPLVRGRADHDAGDEDRGDDQSRLRPIEAMRNGAEG